MALGEPINGTVEEGPYAGATVTGRIRAMEALESGHVLVGLEWTYLSWTDREKQQRQTRFFADLFAVDAKGGLSVARDGTPRLPGVGLLYVSPSKGVLIQSGTVMDWRIVSVSRSQTP